MLHLSTRKTILEKIARFSTISFQNDRLKIMVNLDQGNNLIRHLVSHDEVPKVISFLRECKVNLAVKSSEAGLAVYDASGTPLASA